MGDKVCGRQSSCHLERAAVKEQRGERRVSLIQRGQRVEKKSQRQSEPGLEVLVSTHDRFPIGRRARILFPGHKFLLGENVKALCYVFFSPGSSPLMDLRRLSWIALTSS